MEGKSDFYLLRYAHEVLGIGSNCPALIPGTGAGTLDTPIRLYIGWGKSFVVLLDGDDAGREQLKRYSDLFEPALQGRCALLPDLCEDPSVIEAEALLTAADRKAVIDAIYPDPAGRPEDKKALSRAICELYARGEQVKLEKTSVERITKLIDALAQKLVQQT